MQIYHIYYLICRTPEKYYDLKLPHKLPPAKEPLPVTGLPMLGYMEQSCATALVKALTACGNFKPKYPFLCSSRSALMYVAYHLKGKHTCSYLRTVSPLVEDCCKI